MTQPLGGVTAIISAVLLAFLALVAVTTLRGSNSMFGFGHAFICVNEPGTYGSGNWNVSPFGFTARPGAYIQVNGTIQACTGFHPAITQRALYALTSLPSRLMWGAMLFLLVRLFIIARREGPFTLRTAAIMRRLGWLIIGDCGRRPDRGFRPARAGRHHDHTTGHRVHLPLRFAAPLPFSPMVPAAALAGAALLTFARITRLGAAMDDEIKGTV